MEEAVSTLTCNHEIRPILETGLERAKARFDEAVAIARHLAEAERLWVRLGRLLTIMERDGDLERLGFKSINSCIMEIEVLTGYGRSSIYAFKQLYSECAANGAEVPEMPLGSGHTFKKLSSTLQRDPEIIEAIRTKKPKQFKTQIASEHPECHIDDTEDLKLHLESSFVPIFHELVECTRVLYEQPEMSYERAIEIWGAGWMSEPFEDSGMSNLERARQLRALNI